MALLGTIASGAGSLGLEGLKQIFPQTFANVSKIREIATGKKSTDKKDNKTSSSKDIEFGTLGAGVIQTNELLSESIAVQKLQNEILQQVLYGIKNIKSGSNNSILSNLTDLIPSSGLMNILRARGVGGVLARTGAFAVGDMALGGLGFGGKEINDKVDQENWNKANLWEKIQSLPARAIENIGDYIMPNAANEARASRIASETDYINKKYGINTKLEGETRETTSQIIEFNARDIKFTAKDMLIRTSEIKVNGEVQKQADRSSGATPNSSPAGSTPSVLGVSPTTPGSTASADGSTGPAGLTTVTSKSGPSTKVGSTYASNFQSFINDLEATGYKISSLGGYANRANANNPNVKSYHAMGAAIDINPASNPNRSTKTDLPQETGALAAKHGLGWGMNWNSVKDPMHFSAAKSEQGSFDIQRGSMASYASGSDYVPESGPAIVGEKGPELVMSQDGSSRLTGDGPHAENLQQGDSVLPADKTKEILPDASKMGVVQGTKYPTRAPVGTMYDSFINEKGEKINKYVDEDLTTRFVPESEGEWKPQKFPTHAPVGTKYGSFVDKDGKKWDKFVGHDLTSVFKPAKHYAEGTNKAVMDLNQRYSGFGGTKVERSGSYMSRPHFYDTDDKLYAAMGERTSKQPYTDKDDRESYETIEAFRRGEKPEKPAGMTQREYLYRMSEHGAMGLLTGAIKPEELQKASKQADQPLWMTKAQNKTEAMVKSVEGVRSPTGEKIAVKPLFAPAETDAGKFSAMDYVEPKAPPPPMPEPAPGREMSDEEMRNQAWRDRGRAMGGRPNSYIPPPGSMGSPSGDLLKAYLTSGQ